MEDPKQLESYNFTAEYGNDQYYIADDLDAREQMLNLVEGVALLFRVQEWGQGGSVGDVDNVARGEIDLDDLVDNISVVLGMDVDVGAIVGDAGDADVGVQNGNVLRYPLCQQIVGVDLRYKLVACLPPYCDVLGHYVQIEDAGGWLIYSIAHIESLFLTRRRAPIPINNIAIIALL